MNRLYVGDNLEIMREMEAGHIDLICTDPPFNSGRNYNAFFPESKAQEKAFEDIWKWDNEAIEARGDIRERADADDTYEALNMCLEGYDLVLQKSVSGNKGAMRAYLAFMGPRLAEMHRLLKNSGSIYLHCDPTASHYLKIVMDSLFGEKNFRNEIVWSYEKWTNASKYFQRNHDVILMYSASNSYLFNKQYGEMTKRQKQLIDTGYNVGSSGGKKIVRIYDRNNPNVVAKIPDWIDEDRTMYDVPIPKGKALKDVWQISFLNSQSKERTGYPTQKPLALLDRIIKASSNEGDLVLDPFLGSGTTAVAAKRLNRSCIGIEINADCIEIAEKRIKENV